jgi:O-antigen ligase
VIQKAQLKIHFTLTLVFAFLLPIYPNFSSLTSAFLLLNWLIGLFFGIQNFRDINKRTLLLSAGFFGIYLLGLFWTHNTASGLRELETKLTFLLFPLIFLTVQLSADKIREVFRTFIRGCFFAVIFLLFLSLWQLIETRYRIAHGEVLDDFGINFFMKDRLSRFVHPSYLAMYLLFSVWLMYKERIFITAKRWGRIAVYTLLVTGILLTVSKAGILGLTLIGSLIMYELMVVRKKWKLGVGIIVTVLIMFTTLFVSVPQFSERFLAAISTVTHKGSSNEPKESTASRIQVWKVSAELISENPFYGTGTGSAKDEMCKLYEKYGMLAPLEIRMNSHNQYLETTVTLGVFGLLWLLAMLLLPMIDSFRRGNALYWGFILIIILNIFVESMFEAQSGVLFFTFFNVLSFIYFSKKEKL